MVSAEDSEPVWLSRITQDLFELRPPVTWDTSRDNRFKRASVDLARVSITWDYRGGGEPKVDVVAWEPTYDHDPYISVLYPTLLELLAPLIETVDPRTEGAPRPWAPEGSSR